MAYPQHHYFVMGGELDPSGTGAWDEVWQIGVRGDWSASSSDEDSWLAAVMPFLLSMYADATHQSFHHLSRLSFAKMNAIATDGTYLDPSHPHTIFAATPAVGTENISNMLTLDESITWGWTTSKLRGTASHGRCYPPNSKNRIQNGAQEISGTSQGQVTDSAKRFLDIISATRGDATFTPQVISKKDGSRENITGIRIGSVIDVQRRRRNKLNENYVSITYP